MHMYIHAGLTRQTAPHPTSPPAAAAAVSVDAGKRAPGTVAAPALAAAAAASAAAAAALKTSAAHICALRSMGLRIRVQ